MYFFPIFSISIHLSAYKYKIHIPISRHLNSQHFINHTLHYLHLIPYKLNQQCIISIPTQYTSIKTHYLNSPIVSITKNSSTLFPSIFLVLIYVPIHSQPLPSRPTKTKHNILPLFLSSPGGKLRAARLYIRTQGNFQVVVPTIYPICPELDPDTNCNKTR